MINKFFKQSQNTNAGDLEALAELSQKATASLAAMEKQRESFNSEVVELLLPLIASHEQAEADLSRACELMRKFKLEESKAAARSLEEIRQALGIYREQLKFFESMTA